MQIGNEKLVSVIKDPFKKNKIKSVQVWFGDFWSNGDYHATGKITFKNGETTGEQNFKGKSFDDVVLQIRAVLDNL